MNYNGTGNTYINILGVTYSGHIPPPLPINGYKEACLEIAPQNKSTITTSFDVYMGKLTHPTLAAYVAQKEHLGCYNVQGPELEL